VRLDHALSERRLGKTLRRNGLRLGAKRPASRQWVNVRSA
jgi:hypothetical protein